MQEFSPFAVWDSIEYDFYKRNNSLVLILVSFYRPPEFIWEFNSKDRNRAKKKTLD
jgi:hypothetical protein